MIKRTLADTALLCALLLLAGCSMLRPDTDSENQPVVRAWLKPGVSVILPAPGITPAVNVQQLLTGSFHGETQSLLVLLSADEQKITLAGLSSLGIRLFLLTYDQYGIHTEQSLIVPELPPASQVLADVMLSHWPVSAWRTRLPTGWTLLDQGDTRELRDENQRLISKITYQQQAEQRKPIRIDQYAFHYHIAIQYLRD